ncbi:MAG: U32 family peptidase [Eubacterium sp.]|nr:U32 family peptidase [Eubacterium sp.]
MNIQRQPACVQKTGVPVPELLAPAGSFAICRAVIFAGADAVYAGGSRFGARAYAQNFTQEELLAAIDFAHLYGKKLYLTVNTLLKQEEMDALYDYLLPYYLHGLDAVIVQDFGVMQMVRQSFPLLAVHISTQMSVASAYGFAYLKKLGASRIVPARELSFAEIQSIRSQSDLEIECFVHGALCYCYSGQCLLSSMLGGRSGNRGRCAQPCRLPYTVLDRQKKPVQSGYPLSPKDLCTIERIPQLIDAGITSFKIEGRMKSAEYAAGVTAVYRKYIDQYLETGTAKVDSRDYERLLHAGNRSGFTDGYYSRHNGREMITMARPAHEKGELADLNFLHEKKLPVQAKTVIKIGEPASLFVSCQGNTAAACGGIVQQAKKQPLRREMLAEQLSKTGNTPFAMERLEVEMDASVFLPIQSLNQLRREALGQLEEQMLLRFRRSSQGCKDHRAGFAGNKQGQPEQKASFTAVVEENGQLGAVLEPDFIRRIYLDSSMYSRKHFTAQLKEHVNLVHAAGKQAYLALPPVFRQSTAQFYREQWQDVQRSGVDGFLVKTLDELGFLDEMQADQESCVLCHSLYTYSDDTKASFCKAGWQYDTVPLELNQKELRARNNTASELIVYGYMPLMVSAQCIQKTAGRCTGERSICYLKDRYAKVFPVRNVCSECYNTIYNAQPLSLIQLSKECRRLHPAAYRLWFTTEDEETVRLILHCVQASFFGHQTIDMASVVGAYTNGHYKRGTE